MKIEKKTVKTHKSLEFNNTGEFMQINAINLELKRNKENKVYINLELADAVKIVEYLNKFITMNTGVEVEKAKEPITEGSLHRSLQISDFARSVLDYTYQLLDIDEIELFQIMNKSRIQLVAFKRNFIMYVLRVYGRATLQQIGFHFDRHHSSVMHNIEEGKNYLCYDCYVLPSRTMREYDVKIKEYAEKNLSSHYKELTNQGV